MRFKVQVLSHDVAPNDLLQYTQCRLNAWARWEVARRPTSIGAPFQSMYVVFGLFFNA